MIRKIFIGLGFLLLIALIWNWSLVVYGIRMGAGQLKVVWNARPVEEVLSDSSFPDSLKMKLKLIEEIRRFGIDSLGLKDTENYKTLYDQRNEEIMWVVQACEPFQLNQKMWRFPVVGSVPYKGFFDKESALKEREKLMAEGYDVSVRNPGGWSTLGWFTDPILSGMLNRDEGDLASLILHEMVHATIFIKDDIDYNENLASFIGDTASYKFLEFKYGSHSKEYTDYLHEDQDYRKYSKHILRGTTSLDSLYKTLKQEDALELKKEKKEKMIRKIVESIDTLTLFVPRKGLFKTKLPNNTFFMSYRLYQAKQTDFKEEFDGKFGGDLKKYIRDLAKRHPYL